MKPVNRSSVTTAIQIVRNESTRVLYNGYCVDVSSSISRTAPYKVASTQDIQRLFDPDVVKQIRWIVNHSYPLITDLIYINQLIGSNNISIDEIVAATQSAIWSLTNPPFTLDALNNSQNVLLMYNYLLDNCGPGWEPKDVEDYGDSIWVTFFSQKATLQLKNQYYLYGPMILQTNSPLGKQGMVYSLGSNFPDIEFCDLAGNKVTTVQAGGDSFYAKFPADFNESCFNLTLYGDIYYGLGVDVLVSSNPKSPSQALVVTEPLSKHNSNEQSVCACQLIVRKLDAEDCYETLSGATFELSDLSGYVLQTKTSDTAGMIYFNHVLPGNYLLKEIIAPNGYILPKDPIEVTVTCPSTVITVDNEKAKCKIKIIKYDRHNPDRKLECAEFAIYNTDGAKVGYITTNKYGVAISEPLPDGKYLLIEKKAPRGYILDDQPIIVNLNHEGKCPDGYKVIYICNVKKKSDYGKIVICKVDECKKPITVAGVTFDIKDENNKVVDTISTNCEGVAVSRYLELGLYKIVETSPPCGYFALPDKIKVELDDREVKICVKNIRKARDCDCNS